MAPGTPPAASHSAITSDEAELPASGPRSFVTFLIFVHLFALAMAIAGNLRPTSPLRTQLGDIPILSDYTEAIGMNTGYNYNITYGLGEDTPQFISLSKPQEDADPLVFSPDGISPGLRKARYRRLLFDAYYLAVQGAGNASLIPKQIAKYLLERADLAAADTRVYRLQLRNRNLRSPEMVLSADPERRDPFAQRLLETVYNVDVWFADGEFYANEVTSASEGSTLKTESPQPAQKD